MMKQSIVITSALAILATSLELSRSRSRGFQTLADNGNGTLGEGEALVVELEYFEDDEGAGSDLGAEPEANDTDEQETTTDDSYTPWNLPNPFAYMRRR